MNLDDAIKIINPETSRDALLPYAYDPEYRTKVVEAACRAVVGYIRAPQVAEKNEPLTLEELRQMGGEPAWCENYKCWGIVKCETIGMWANIPFLVGSSVVFGIAVDFECNIENRGLTLYRRPPVAESK